MRMWWRRRKVTQRNAVIASVNKTAAINERSDFIRHLLGGPKVDSFQIERSTDAGRRIEL